MHLCLRDSAGVEQEIRTTAEHPVYVPGQGWIAAGQLKPGDTLAEPTSGISTITAVRHEDHPEGISVYNFRVADAHTYFVSAETSDAEPVWVHNASDAYRALRSEDLEAIQEGRRIMPKGTSGSILDHIQGRPTKYISVSRTSAGAAYYDTGYGVVELDLEIALKTGSTMVPYEQLLQVARRSGTVQDVRNVIRAQEFLLKGGIDPRAVVRFL